MKVVSINKGRGDNVVKFLEGLLVEARGGDISGIAVACVCSNGDVSASWSGGSDAIKLYAGTEHLAKQFYLDNIDDRMTFN
ncbi:MAG: hypothetical protein JKY96_02340 [Phycisphaerales bacterium]|nr:hypothetical protein [Phycisphaerales bacterium]